jgi:protease IV
MRTILVGAALLASTLLQSLTAQAQLPADQPTRLPAWGRSPVSVEDTTALVVNPANIAFLPGGELRWSSVYLDEQALLPYQGHAIAFGFPIPLVRLSTAIRLDVVDPPRDASLALFGESANYQFLTWGLAFEASEQFALGFSLQRTYSDRSTLHGLSSWSLGGTSRPWNFLGVAFVANDLNAPTNDAGGFINRTYDMATAIRPLSTRAVELGLSAKYVDQVDGYWIPRATLGIDIPPLGRLRGDFSLSDPGEQFQDMTWLAAATMAFYFNGTSGSMEASAGSIFGDALGSEADDKAYRNIVTEVAFKSYREPVGVETPGYALRIRIEDTPGVRGHTALLRQLWSIAERESSVDAVVLELRTAPADSFAHVEELRDALFLLRQSGKRVLCHLEDADGASLYLCSAADRILINPAGGIRFAGLRARYFYLAGLLEKLGIRADFVRIGAHKSAPEMFTRESASETARADHVDMLQQFEKHFTLDVAAGRKIPALELRKRIATGPFIANEARAAGLVDGFAFDDQLEEEVSRLAGRHLSLIDDRRSVRAPENWGNGRSIALIYVDGDMVDGRSQTIPLLGTRLVGSYTIAESIKQAREDGRVGAVVLRVETGGGSAMAADVIWREVELTTKVKPVIVSMGTAAASGGYYIASPATRIYANPLTITGSIGIFYGKADVAELLRKIGVSVEVYKTTPRADAESIFRPFTDEERKELERKVQQFYDVFLDRVATGRKLQKAQVDAVGQGRVWTGEQARDRRLVDELGGLRQALDEARRLARLPRDAAIIEMPPPDTTLLGRLLGIEGVQEDQKALSILPAQLYDLAVALAPFAIQASDKPLARMELVLVK